MSGAGEAAWTLSALGYEDGNPLVTRIRDTSAAEVEEGRERMGRIRWLARQAAFERLLESAERWKRLVAKAVGELRDEGEISRQSQAAARAELATFVRAAERFQEDLRNNAATVEGWSDQDRGQFERILGEASGAPQSMLLLEICRSGESRLLLGSEEEEA